MLYLAIVVGVAFMVSLAALFVALAAPKPSKELRRAFEALEEEFEDLRDTVRSSVGRISRLKRSIMNGEVTPEPGSESVSEAPALQTTFPGLTPRQAAHQAEILRRRAKGGIQ